MSEYVTRSIMSSASATSGSDDVSYESSSSLQELQRCEERGIHVPNMGAGRGPGGGGCEDVGSL